MSDPIQPPAARRPEEALELVSQALSDGDLEAAVAQYEKTALLACWPCWPRGDDPPGTPRQGWPRGDDPPGTPRQGWPRRDDPPGTPRQGWPRRDDPIGTPGEDLYGYRDVREALTAFMALRLPLAVRIVLVLESPEVTLVVCERRVAGTDPDGTPVRLTGHGCAMLRPQLDGSWRIVADVWHVGPELPAGPPEIPLAPGREAVRRAGRGGPPYLA
jgi:hypothetical protein